MNKKENRKKWRDGFIEVIYDNAEVLLENVMSALNSLLGVSIFDRFIVAGHNESWDL